MNWIMIRCTRIHVLRYDSGNNEALSAGEQEEGREVAIVATARKLMRAIYVTLQGEEASGWMAD